MDSSRTTRHPFNRTMSKVCNLYMILALCFGFMGGLFMSHLTNFSNPVIYNNLQGQIRISSQTRIQFDLDIIDTSVENATTKFVENKIINERNASTGYEFFREDELVKKLPRMSVHSTTNYYRHNLFVLPKKQDKVVAPMNLLAIAVGFKQRAHVDVIIQKSIFQVVLFHYDNMVDKWSEFEWSHRAIHIQSAAQSKWWFAKRFLHPDVVEPNEYIFIWDDDLNVDNFDPLKFVETQAPVFEHKVWRCVWNLVQNDLVVAWGLDFLLHECVSTPPHKYMGIVDSQWVIHNSAKSLGSQGSQSSNANGRQDLIKRSMYEWAE